ncbi:RhoGAP domain-containing protein [Colletotrichum kahawae]|uniref:RhoGAP domain-containing protein n=1 Tax=Colletotrichum kahawae TaxID=34407 RepID=A0AAD9YDM4_COLKA|nr:RhoGAP domain-containing protein [Colletotrichum kahawae]
MVRLSGKNFLYLPEPYAPSSLLLPTCFRATAQYLVQYGPETRGVFRIPGSIRRIDAIFDYYCDEKAGEEVTNTIRCASLPAHINVGTHDIASAFKKFLSVLPGGILGTLSLFDALVAIQCQLRGEPELSRTKETKLRARLIALAIGTVESQFQRELICAVFGLLSVIGRAGEMAAREDERGHPLPTSDLMGYAALGVVFGPLLVGELLDSYTMKLAIPSAGLLLLPLTPPQLERERQRTAKPQDEPPLPAINKVHVANDIAEMLITNWREIVKNMKDLRVLARIGQREDNKARHKSHWSSSSDPFTIGLPRGWKSKPTTPGATIDREGSPTPDSPTPTCRALARSVIPDSPTYKLDVQKVRPQMSLSPSSSRLPPPAEEFTANNHGIKRIGSKQSNVKTGFSRTSSMRTRGTKAERASEETSLAAASSSSISGAPPEGNRREISDPTSDGTPNVRTPMRVGRHGKHPNNNTRVYDLLIPERTSSRSTVRRPSEPLNTMNVKEASETGHGPKFRLSERSLAQASEENAGKDARFVSTALRRLVGTDRSGGSSGNSTPRTPKRKHIVPDDMSPRTVIRLRDSDSLTPTARSFCGSDVAQENTKPKAPAQKTVVANAGTQTGNFQKVAGRKSLSDNEFRRPRKSDVERERPYPRTPRHSDETDREFDNNSSIQITPKEYCAEMTVSQRPRNTGTDSTKAL